MGILVTCSPRELLVRWYLDYKKHCGVLPGTYCKVNNMPVLLNMTIAQMHKGIALGPTSNLQRSVKFYCLSMGHVLKWHSFTPIPMPDRVIKQVNTIRAKRSKVVRFLCP